MKTEQWLAAFAVFVACGKSADSKDPPKQAPAKPVEKPAVATSLSGFYRADSVTLKGKTIKLKDAFLQSLTAEGDAKPEVDLMRMTLEMEGAKLTVGTEQVWGAKKGSATFCAVYASSEVEWVDGKLELPSFGAVASGGIVEDKDGDSSNDTAKCNVSLEKGSYEVRTSGKNVDLAMTTPDGEAVLHLVPDEKTIDLKARAAAFAARK